MENEEIKELGSLTERNIHCIAVIGQIEGHQLLAPDVKTTKYEHLLPQLAAVEESPDIDGLLILINTCGGDVEAGLAIAELISGMKKPTASLVLGGGHSIGVPLAVAADMCFIAPSAAMTIHPVRLSGTVIGVSQTYNYLARIQERIVRFITQNSRIEEGKLTELMLKTGELAGDVGSVVYGEETVELGLADRVGGLSDALGYLHGRIDKVKKRETQDPAQSRRALRTARLPL